MALWVRCLLDRVQRRRPTALTTAGACWGRPFPSGYGCVPDLGIAGAADFLRGGRLLLREVRALLRGRLWRDRLRHFDVADRGAGALWCRGFPKGDRVAAIRCNPCARSREVYKRWNFGWPDKD